HHVLTTSQLRRFKELGGAGAEPSVRMTLQRLDAGRVHIAAFDLALVNRVKKDGDPGRPGEEPFDRAGSQLWAKAWPGLEQKRRNGWVVEAGQSFHHGRLDRLRLAEVEELLGKVLDLGKRHQAEHTDRRHPVLDRTLLIRSGLQSLAE